MSKAEAATAFLKSRAPSLEVDYEAVSLEGANAAQLVVGDVDLVVDCLDNMGGRYACSTLRAWRGRSPRCRPAGWDGKHRSGLLESSPADALSASSPSDLRACQVTRRRTVRASAYRCDHLDGGFDRGGWKRRVTGGAELQPRSVSSSYRHEDLGLAWSISRDRTPARSAGMAVSTARTGERAGCSSCAGMASSISRCEFPRALFARLSRRFETTAVRRGESIIQMRVGKSELSLFRGGGILVRGYPRRMPSRSSGLLLCSGLEGSVEGAESGLHPRFVPERAGACRSDRLSRSSLRHAGNAVEIHNATGPSPRGSSAWSILSGGAKSFRL